MFQPPLVTSPDAVLAFLSGSINELPARFRTQAVVDAERFPSLANWVWKASFQDGSAVVVKQYGPHLSSDPSIIISADRADVEWHALRTAHALSVQQPGGEWGVPEPYFFDAGRKVVVMEHIPFTTLFAHLSSSSSSSPSPSPSPSDLGPHLP